jgi:hypothetical protein
LIAWKFGTINAVIASFVKLFIPNGSDQDTFLSSSGGCRS